jgi:hypothetical protein
LAIFYTEDILEEGYTFTSAAGCEQYHAPPEGPLESYVAFIRGLPAAALPEVSWLPNVCPGQPEPGLNQQTSVPLSLCCHAPVLLVTTVLLTATMHALLGFCALVAEGKPQLRIVKSLLCVYY